MNCPTENFDISDLDINDLNRAYYSEFLHID